MDGGGDDEGLDCLDQDQAVVQRFPTDRSSMARACLDGAHGWYEGEEQKMDLDLVVNC